MLGALSYLGVVPERVAVVARGRRRHACRVLQVSHCAEDVLMVRLVDLPGLVRGCVITALLLLLRPLSVPVLRDRRAETVAQLWTVAIHVLVDIQSTVKGGIVRGLVCGLMLVRGRCTGLCGRRNRVETSVLRGETGHSRRVVAAAIIFVVVSPYLFIDMLIVGAAAANVNVQSRLDAAIQLADPGDRSSSGLANVWAIRGSWNPGRISVVTRITGCRRASVVSRLGIGERRSDGLRFSTGGGEHCRADALGGTVRDL